MKAYEFDIKKAKGGAYLLDGSDSYWKDKISSAFFSIVPEEYRSFNVKQLDKIESPESLRDALITFSMFDSPIVVVSYDEKFEDDKKSVVAYEKVIKDIDQSTFFLIVNSGKISANFKKLFTIIECDKPPIEVVKNIAIKALGKTSIEGRALDLLIQYSNMDLNRVVLEIQKLTAYTDGEKIKVADVELMVSNDIEDVIFELSEAIAIKNNQRVKNLVDRFIEKGLPYAQMLSLITGFYRRVFHVSLSEMSDENVATALGVKEWAIKKARQTAAKYTKTRLKEIMDMLIEADYGFKSGKMSEETAFKTVISKFMTF